jgi:hypothetical protein
MISREGAKILLKYIYIYIYIYLKGSVSFYCNLARIVLVPVSLITHKNDGLKTQEITLSNLQVNVNFGFSFSEAALFYAL